jgi:hypothetical protein
VSSSKKTRAGKARVLKISDGGSLEGRKNEPFEIKKSEEHTRIPRQASFPSLPDRIFLQCSLVVGQAVERTRTPATVLTSTATTSSKTRRDASLLCSNTLHKHSNWSPLLAIRLGEARLLAAAEQLRANEVSAGLFGVGEAVERTRTITAIFSRSTTIPLQARTNSRSVHTKTFSNRLSCPPTPRRQLS